MFEFVVRRMRFLSRIPGLPHLFDALLVGWTWTFNRRRVKAIEVLEAAVLRQPGMGLKVHRLGGIEFVRQDGVELGHVHGHGLVDAPVGKETARDLIATSRAKPHHVFPNSIWVSFQMESEADVPFAMSLIAEAGKRA
jgi:hypothetical protein